ncbi:SEN1 N terminal-domain-containing protein [Peziza echinospora]|nr:SEN1 N terminal-domain-containing protein [Peziza echinospora]
MASPSGGDGIERGPSVSRPRSLVPRKARITRRELSRSCNWIARNAPPTPPQLPGYIPIITPEAEYQLDTLVAALARDFVTATLGRQTPVDWIGGGGIALKMASEEQEVLEALSALSSIPDEYHWFCDLTEFEDTSQQPECALTTKERIEKTQILLKLFAVENHATLPWVKEQLTKQLSRCAECVKTFHETKREMFIDMQREYDLADIEGFFERLTDWDIGRILPELARSEQIVRNLPQAERRLNNVDKEGLYAMYDVLCDPNLLKHEPLGSYFRFTFSAIQQKKSKLKVDHELPAMIVFLFDKDPGLQEWAVYICKRQLPTMDPAVFEKGLLPFLIKAIKKAAECTNEDELARFFAGALSIVQNASRELILKCICGATEDLIKFTINHVADKAKYLETILLLLGELMRKLRYDFWDAAAPVSAVTFVDWTFANSQFVTTFLQPGLSGDSIKSTLDNYSNWIIPFAETLRPSSRPQTCSGLLYQLLTRFQAQNEYTAASALCLKEGMRVLRMSLDDLSKDGIGGSVDHILCRTTLRLVGQHIAPIRKVTTEPLPPAEIRENWVVAKSEARVILQCALMLDCKVIFEDYRLLSKDKPLPSGTSTNYFEDLYDTVLARFALNDTTFSTEVLGSLLDLVGLEPLRVQVDKVQEVKPGESPLKVEKLSFNKLWDRLSSTIGEILNRISEFDRGSLVKIISHPKAGRFVISSLFSPQKDWYLPGVDIIKQAFDTMGKVEGLAIMLRDHFDIAIEAFMWGIRRVTMVRTFGPMPLLVKTCGYILQTLCDSPEGLLLQEDRFTTDADKSKVFRFWTYQWDFLGAIFEETIRFQKSQDRNALVEFTRDTMEYADTLFSSFPAFEHAIAPTVPESAFEADSQNISETAVKLLQFGNRSIYKIAVWLRLRDEPLLRLCHDLLCKILKQLENAKITVDPEAVARLMKFATRGDLSKYQTNLTKQQKADLRAACGEPVILEKTIQQQRSSEAKKQTTLAQWTASAEHNKGQEQVQSKKRSDVDVVEISDEDLDGGVEDADMMLALERSERQYKIEQQRRLQKSTVTVPPTQRRALPPPPPKIKHKDAALERARADVAERVRLKKEKEREAAMQNQNKVGSNLASMNIKPRDPAKAAPMVVGDESSSEDEDDEEDDGTGLFALASKSRKTTVMLDGPGHPGFRQPVNFTLQKQMRSAADLRARLTPDLSPLYRRILPWNFFHDSDFPPGSNAKEYNMVSSTFQNVSQYKGTFEPLLMLECWNQFRKAKEENNFTVFEVELATRMNADNFVELHTTIDQGEFTSKKIQIGESDVILLSTSLQPLSSPDEPNCLARVVGINRKRGVVEISLRCLPSPLMLPALKVKAKYRAVKILSLTSLEREYGALLSLMYYDLMDEILHARPTHIEAPAEDRVQDVVSTYQVNTPQAKAICAATDNEGFTLIQGPPGSGKTKTVIGIVGSILTPNYTGGTSKTVKKLLVCAPSNAAVDELVIRFMEGIRTSKGENVKPNIVRLGRSEAINAAVRNVTLEELVDARLSGQEASKKGGNGKGDPALLREEMNKLLAERNAIRAAKDDAFASKHENAVKLQQEERALTDKIRTKGRQIDECQDSQNTDRRNKDILRRKIQQDIMDQAQIICATLSGAGHEMLKGMNVEFDTVVIDEAAQSIELSALIPLKYGCTKCILVGDPKQLPPTVLSRDAARYMFEQSLFVRMQKNHPDDIHLLSIQYRMHPEISKFPSQQFYDSELEDGEGMEKLRRRIWHMSTIFGPYRFFDVQGQESSARGHSLVNHQEVTTAVQLYRRLCADFPEQDFRGMIGIITPYKQQLGELKRRFQNEFGQAIIDTIDFNTTDAFQGREREIIIFSCVRASPSGGVGFLSDIRRMNVGLTRAKSSLFILGNARSLLRNEFWGKLVQDAHARGVFTDGNMQALFSRTARIKDISEKESSLPMAMDIDGPEFSIKKEGVKIEPVDSRKMSLDLLEIPIKKETSVGRVKNEPESEALKDSVTPDPRKRPGTKDPKQNNPRKQQATGQGNNPNLPARPGAPGQLPNRQPSIPLRRPSETPVLPPASLIPPKYNEPQIDPVDTSGGAFCYRCGNTGHIRMHCTNPPNPAKVEHMKKYGRGDPHDRTIPKVQSSIPAEQPRAQKRGPQEPFSNANKRREVDGRVPYSTRPDSATGSSNDPRNRPYSGPSNAGNGQPQSGLPPPPPPSNLPRAPPSMRPVAPPRPKKAADPFIRKKERKPRPPPGPPGPNRQASNPAHIPQPLFTMFPKTTALAAAFCFFSTVSAHFDLVYPADRGDNHASQTSGPCGGLNTPSDKPTPWPVAGGKLLFSAGHDEAKTEVRLNVGNETDFGIVLAPEFNQVGYGKFCFPKLVVPPNTEGVKDGARGVIQVKQFANDGGWLYNCADIIFTNDLASVENISCTNDTGVFSEPINGGGSGSGASTAKIAGTLFIAGLGAAATFVGTMGLF